MSGWIGSWGVSATVADLTVTNSQVITVNTSTNALRITQTGTGNALVVEDSANPDGFPFVVDASGNVNIGVVASYTNAKLNVMSVGSEGPVMLTRASADIVGAELYLRKIRNSNPYVNTIVQSGDGLGSVVFLGNDGTNQVRAAQIDTYVDGTPGINDMPGRLVFSTTADGAFVPTERMRIDSAGMVTITNSSTSDALRITQTGAGNALIIEDSANPDSTPFIVDANGRVGIGGNPSVTLESFSDATSWFRNQAAAGIPIFATYRANGTIASKTVVTSGDEAGRFDVRGFDGANFVQLAQINFYVDGTPGTNDMPGRIVFQTTADGASSPAERMRIDNAGNVYGTSGTTSMTNGFFYIPAAGGAPSGVPTAVAGRVPMYYDTTNNNFYIYNGAWKKILLA
jgi:hypothetical protein